MDSKTNTLSMLGLALRGNHLVVGEEPVEAVARARDARVLLLASDAADNTKRRCRHFAEAGDCLWLTLPYTKAELGQVTGRSAVAICAITDVGMAASFVHKLELMDSKSYSQAAQRLDLKAKRAAERKAEMLAHEKNVRQGKFRKSRKEVPEEPAAAPVPEKQPADSKQSRPYGGQRSGKPGAGRSDSHGRRPYGGRPENGERRSGEGRPSGGKKPFGEKTGGFRKEDRPFSGGKSASHSKSRPSKENRSKPRAKYNPYAHSLPVKKGKGSFRKRED